MLSTPKAKGVLFLASCLCDGLEDNNIKQVTTLLLNKDADPNVLIPTHGVTPFHLVIGNDSIEFAEEVTKLFLRHGGDPNVRSNDGMTPVHVAAAWGRLNILQLLLANGGDPLCLDNDGRSPFHYAFDEKYFKAVTMLAKYCENIHEEDDKPKFSMVLDKILVTSGDLVAEYVTSNDTMLSLDRNNISKNDAFPKFYARNLNFSPTTVELKRVLDTCNAGEIKCESLSNINDVEHVESTNVECPSVSNNTTPQWNNLSQTGDKEALYYSFVDLDFANLHLSNVMQKEKCIVNKIINHLSTTLASECTINETLQNYNRSKRERSSATGSSSDMSPELKENIDTLYEYGYHKSLKDFTSKLRRNLTEEDSLKPSTPLIEKQCSKHNIQSNSKRRYRMTTDRIPLTPTYTLDNSIISMSPNFNTPNDKKRRNAVKTPLILSRYHRNDSIVSKSPNFATPVHRYKDRKKGIGKTSSVNGYFSMYKEPHERKAKAQFFEFNHCKRHIAQSTPRRKRRSIYKLHSSRKRFDSCRQEDDITADELSVPYILKPVNLDKTIFSEEVAEGASHNNILHLDHVSSLLNHKEPLEIRQQNSHGKHLAVKLGKRKYDKNSTTYSDANMDFTHTDLDNNFNQMEKENDSLDDDKNNSTKSENRMSMPFVTIRNHHKAPKTKYLCTNMTMTSTCATKSTKLNRENFVDCSNCDTKKLSNKDPDMDISRTCNLYANNWCSGRFHEPLSHKSTVEYNSCTSILNPNCQILYSTGIGEDDINYKRTEDMFKTNDLNACKIEENS